MTSTIPPNRQDTNAVLDSRAEVQPVGRSTSKDWPAHMILAVKAMAAGADFVPFPYIRATFSTVLILLETVEKVKRNQDDLKELCGSIVEIVTVLRSEVVVHGDKGATRFMGLCEDLIAFLRHLQDELENLLTRRKSIGHRWKQLIKATSMEDQIMRYRNRINELRSNFTLVAAIGANLTASEIHQGVCELRGRGDSTPQFRNISLGDINLLHSIARSSERIGIYTARIHGEGSKMTVVKYEDEKAKWERDLALYSTMRHPNVWQLFGVSTAPGIHALIFHDELVQLAVYRRFLRPSSDLAWTLVEAMLFRQFKDCSKYHTWHARGQHARSIFANKATICVRLNPVQLCLTMPDENLSRYNMNDIHEVLCMWHTSLYEYQPIPPKLSMEPMVETALNHLDILPKLLDWKQFYASLV
ncbi:hypothetical protein C8R44DRAFT_985519, partial [Mycena epipterygia]